MASDEVSIDLDAFDEFEASAWEERVEGYAGFFVAVTGRLVEPRDSEVLRGTRFARRCGELLLKA